MSVGGIISLGLGSWGSVGEIITLGYGSSEPALIARGLCVSSGMVYLPGAKSATTYNPGVKAAAVYLPGAKSADRVC